VGMRILGRWVDSYLPLTDVDGRLQHMSPTTLSLLPRSPALRRRSSSGGSPLRPIVPPGYSHSSPFEDEDGEVELRGPMPIERETADERERSFGAVDEVEYAYGE